MKSFKHSGISKTTDKLVSRLDQLEKLKEIANRKNYPYRVKQLHTRIQEEFDFWNKKGPSAKLLDIKKDLIFIESQTNSDMLNKQRIDLLLEKYGYGKSNAGNSH